MYRPFLSEKRMIKRSNFLVEVFEKKQVFWAIHLKIWQLLIKKNDFVFYNFCLLSWSVGALGKSKLQKQKQGRVKTRKKNIKPSIKFLHPPTWCKSGNYFLLTFALLNILKILVTMFWLRNFSHFEKKIVAFNFLS